MNDDPVMLALLEEVASADARYGPPASTQESLGVLIEEFSELREAIHSNVAVRIATEAVQVAAVAYRLAKVLERGDANFYRRSGLSDLFA